jgi:hypothetical protein
MEHRSGEEQLQKIGQWRKKLPGNQAYKDPDLIFSENCLETYRTQKNYFLKWYLTDQNQYKCECCGVFRWGKENKLLSLELHHIDSNQKNSLISNLQLLCPNCHNLKTVENKAKENKAKENKA